MHTKLAKITLPEFDGNYIHWNHYRDVYTQMIHDTTLLASEKMLHLVNSLSGPAKRLIQNLPINKENYDEAWNIMLNLYNNKRLISLQLTRTIFYHPKLTHVTAQGIRELHDIVLECIAGLKSTDVGVKHWDTILIVMISDKLDSTTLRLYKESITCPGEHQTINEMTNFLNKRAYALQIEEEKAKHQTFQQNTTRQHIITMPNNKEIRCKVCNAAGHSIFYLIRTL